MKDSIKIYKYYIKVITGPDFSKQFRIFTLCPGFLKAIRDADLSRIRFTEFHFK